MHRFRPEAANDEACALVLAVSLSAQQVSLFIYFNNLSFLRKVTRVKVETREGDMISVKFKNLDKSEMARDAAHGRIEALIEKFPDLAKSTIQVTLEMENSPAQAGLDIFKVKVHVARSRYDGITIEKADPNLYIALADVVDHMLENLNRFGDKARVRERRSAREIARSLERQTQDREQKIE